MGGTPDWERRVGLRETNRRRVNEAIERGRRTQGPATFVCECGRTDCDITLTVPLDEYEAVRTSFDRFLLEPGHELAPVDAVVERRDGYVVIAKRGEAAEVAKDTDPRAHPRMTELHTGPHALVPLITGDVPAAPEHVAAVRHAIARFAAANGAAERLLADISLAVSEGVTNIVRHAYRPGDRGLIHYAADVEDGTLEIVIADDGEGIRPGGSDGSGLGLGIVAAVSADFAIRERLPRGTELWMSFLLDA